MNITVEIKPSPEMVALLIDLARALRGMQPLAVAAPTKAAAAVQEAPPPVTKRKRGDWVTDERAALIRSLIAERRQANFVHLAVNALPGLPVEAKTIKWWARVHGITRPISAVQAANIATMRAKRSPSKPARAAESVALPIAAPPAPKPPSPPPAPAAKAPAPRPNPPGAPFKGLIAGPDPFRAQRELATLSASKGRL